MNHSWLLAIVGAVAIVNPARQVAAFPDVDRSPAEARAVAAIAAAVLVVAVALASSVASAALRWFEVSSSTAQMAAGLVVVLTALIDVLRPLPDEITATAGPRAGLVPAGFPLLVRPEVVLPLAVVAASTAWSRSVIPALVAAICVVLWHRAIRSSGPRSSIARAVGALCSVVAVLVGLELIVDGIYRL